MTETNSQDICQRLEALTRQVTALKDCYVTLHNYLISPGNFDAHLTKSVGNIYGAANLIKQAAQEAREQLSEAKEQLDKSEFSQLLQEMRNFEIYVGNRFKEFSKKLEDIEARDFHSVRIQVNCDGDDKPKQDVSPVVPKKRGRPRKVGR